MVKPEWWPSHIWNVSNDAHVCKSHVSRHISDYYQKENLSVLPRIASSASQQYQRSSRKAHPRHHALILAALGSSSQFVSREFPVITGYEHDASNNTCRGGDHHNSSRWFQSACARCHDNNYESPLTRVSSAYQKHHLTALSAITGLLVTRLMGKENCHSVTKKKKQSEITSRYVHSALAAEYLVGHRYYRNLAKCRSNVRHPIGFIACNVKSNLTAADVTPEALCATKDKLRDTYNANIERLLSMIILFKRGFISIDQIREDPEFIEMNTAFWRLANQLNKLKESAVISPAISPSLFLERKNAKHLGVISLMAEPAVVAPKMYDYDITHLFDNANQSYGNYVKVTKQTWARLANEGSTASFLAFAAIEPSLVTEEYAPNIGGMPGELHGLSLRSCANYIPSRHPVFGALRVKHRCHIMRTADAVNNSSQRVHPYNNAPLIGVTRTDARFGASYAPFNDIVEEIRRIAFPDVIQQFPDTHENTGEIIPECQANDEFKERVYPLGMVIKQHQRVYDSDDYDDNKYYDDDYDDDYSDNGESRM